MFYIPLYIVQASVQVDGQQSRWFRVEEGLRQDCPLSPLLYSIYIMGMVEELERESLGVKYLGFGVEHYYMLMTSC